MKQSDKLKEKLEELRKLAEETILYLPKMDSIVWEEKEPLIKDKKIRNAVRAWAKENNVTGIWVDYEDQLHSDLRLTKRNHYTITELCGEERMNEDINKIKESFNDPEMVKALEDFIQNTRKSALKNIKKEMENWKCLKQL